MEETTFSQEREKANNLLCSTRELSTLNEIKKWAKEQVIPKPESEQSDSWNACCELLEEFIDEKIKQLKQE